MEFHLDREIRLTEESEYKTLYPWALQEFDSDGDKVGSEQIPWEWNLVFSASELRYSSSLEGKSSSGRA